MFLLFSNVNETFCDYCVKYEYKQNENCKWWYEHVEVDLYRILYREISFCQKMEMNMFQTKWEEEIERERELEREGERNREKAKNEVYPTKMKVGTKFIYSLKSKQLTQSLNQKKKS